MNFVTLDQDINDPVNMKNIAIYMLLFVTGLLFSCDDSSSNSADEFTGRESAFILQQGSDFPISGTVTFKERTDFSLQVVVELTGTEGNITHPVHLHYGNLSIPDAEIAVLLNDLNAANGISETIVNVLSDESKFKFDDLATFEGSVKIHLAANGDGRNVVLAGGNIGLAADKSNSGGRVNKIAVCQSE